MYFIAIGHYHVDRYLTSLSGTKTSCLLNYSLLYYQVEDQIEQFRAEYPINLRRISCDSATRTVEWSSRIAEELYCE